MKKEQLIITGIILGIIILIVLLYKKIVKPRLATVKEAQTPSKTANIGNAIVGFTCKYGDSFPLRYGSCGEKVKELQRYLKINADGQFGPKTQAAVLAKFGDKIVTESMWNSPTVGKESNSSTPISIDKPREITEIKSSDDITKLVVDIHSDLSQAYLTGRTEEYPWDVLAQQSVENLRKISDKYKSVYGKNLRDAVDRASFNFTTDVDNRILSGLEAAQSINA